MTTLSRALHALVEGLMHFLGFLVTSMMTLLSEGAPQEAAVFLVAS